MTSRPWPAAVLLLAMAGQAAAGEIANDVFRVDKSAALTVRCNGEPLIAGDRINYLGDLTQADEVIAGEQGRVPVLNVIRKNHPAVRFRKEAALHADGRMELTVRMRLLPYTNKPEEKTLTYSFRIPVKRLAGARFKALAGRIYRTKIVEGVVAPDGKDGDIVGDRCRFIAFASDTLKLVVDFDPYGLMSSGDYCRYGEPVGAWRVEREGDDLVFSFGQSARFYGGVFSGKVLFYRGEFDHRARHFHQQWSYHGPTAALAQFTFGVKAETKGFHRADVAPYDAKRAWGWADPAGLAVVQTESPDVIDNCVRAPNGAARVFKLDVTPGRYMVTVRAGHNGKAIGPFGVQINGKPAAKAVRVKAGETRTLILPGQVRSPHRQLEIGFVGPGCWAVRSIVVQPILYENEDFNFERGMWVVDGLFSPELQ